MKTLALRLGYLASVVVGMSFGLGELTANASPYEYLNQTTGSYSGLLTYDGGEDKVVTELFLADTGALIGSLVLVGSVTPGQKNELVFGNISSCKSVDVEERKVLCEWNDRNGSGYVEFSFSEKFDKFQGKWRMKGEDKWFSWTGSKFPNLPQANPVNF
jgi:hypothetical protein